MSEKKKQEQDEKPADPPIVVDINNGHISVPVGGGLTIDPLDGKIGIQIAPGIGFEF